VLTRLPEPFRIAAPQVAEYLSERYPGERITLPKSERRALIGHLAQLSISGGPVYDALVALTAVAHGRSLISCDRRAVPTYERVGVGVVYI
jgi:toxin FitB